MPEPGFLTHLPISYEEAIEKVTAALKTEGFGVLTEINVKDTMKKKIDVDFKKYAILGACNPHLAYRAISARPEIGLLLPCNVIVYEEEGGAVVNIVDPISMLGVVDDPALAPIADEARAKLQRVAVALAS